MKNIFLCLVLSLLISGCMSVAKLEKPKADAYFVLEENYTRTETRGLLKYKWVEGLKAGKYKLVGTDSDGEYFMGEGDCVIMLSQERADKYLQSGEITPFVERNKEQLTMAGGTGGLFLPKPGSKKEARIFYEVRNAVDGSAQGLTGIAIVQLSEGELGFVSYANQNVFLSQLKIVRD